MINSIQQFQENGIGKIEKITSKFYKNPSNIAEYVKGITENIVELRLSLIIDRFSASVASDQIKKMIYLSQGVRGL